MNNHQPLPYYDTLIDTDPTIRALVSQLIHQEPSPRPALDLPALPPAPVPTPLPPAPSLTPPSVDAPLAEWVRAADEACIHLEYERIRHDNLVLLSQHGQSKWDAYMAHQESLVVQLEAQLAGVKASIESLNKERRQAHLFLGQALSQADSDWIATAKKNLILRRALEERKKASS